MERLPVELTQMVMSATSDILILKRVALSCPILYYAFLSDESKIMTNVLLNQVNLDVLPEAVATLASSRLQPHAVEPDARKRILDFVTGYLQQRQTPLKSFTMGDGFCLGKLHFMVSDFARMFAKTALAKAPVCSSKYTAPSRNEICRIERAFYWFEIFCNLFRESPRGRASSIFGEERPLFFANFAPWENEQLGCIHDFLFRLIYPSNYEPLERTKCPMLTKFHSF